MILWRFAVTAKDFRGLNVLAALGFKWKPSSSISTLENDNSVYEASSIVEEPLPTQEKKLVEGSTDLSLPDKEGNSSKESIALQATETALPSLPPK